METFYLDDATGAGVGAFDSVITKIRSGWCKFRDLVLLLPSSGFPLEAIKVDIFLHVKIVLCYMEVRLGQLIRKM